MCCTIDQIRQLLRMRATELSRDRLLLISGVTYRATSKAHDFLRMFGPYEAAGRSSKLHYHQGITSLPTKRRATVCPAKRVGLYKKKVLTVCPRPGHCGPVVKTTVLPRDYQTTKKKKRKSVSSKKSPIVQKEMFI